MAAVRTCLDRLGVIAAGVAARRSHRDRGYQGLASKRGHRTPAAMIQSITGSTAAAARRAVQVGESLLPSTAPVEEADSAAIVQADAGDAGVPPEAAPWHEPLRRALLSGGITLDQHDAIRGGLGEPPVDAASDANDVWSIAAAQLVGEAQGLPVEELRARARAVRDALDPAGAEMRFAERYEARSFRLWSDRNGQHHGHFVFDDDAAAWVRSIIDSALRPRRGGPRFVDSEEKAAAASLETDGRSNDQLAYDLMFDVIRAGAVASAEDVFGTRQPGVRLVVVHDPAGPRDAFGRMRATGYTEDRGDAVPGSVVDRAVCESGVVRAEFDRTGNPLDLGREQRLFGRAQRLMLALRDGGCRWPGCTRPPSYCEAHHCDHWQADEGRTDVDRGILLCRHHHMLLHNNGWKITREGTGPFILNGPPGAGIAATPLIDRPAWAWIWSPPPPPDRPEWRTAAPAAA
ncbi:HNH endonuclease signature motif containing protein [Microbacterium sp. SLBN-146]|uniref:HNH endonuclease signature motif containing protein n=1 Tax=Microbacterium sp. SLBN-146 TaxID=2768457 RepID=UPI0021B21860|nr:HNH endonuclease signature motif containing protein [Microbacterium sp. SLBN-146]